MPSCEGEAFMVALNRVAPTNSKQAAPKNFGFANMLDMAVSSFGLRLGSYNLLLVTDGASSSHGLGGIVGPTSSTGAESAGTAFLNPMPSCEGEAFMVALNRVAPTNSKQAAPKNFGFANMFDMAVSSFVVVSVLTICCWLQMARRHPKG